VPAAAGHLQRSPPLAIDSRQSLGRPPAGVDIGPSRDQKLHDLKVPTAARPNQRILVSGHDLLDRGAAIEEERDHREVSCAGGHD
jgi:hypothetical protein